MAQNQVVAIHHFFGLGNNYKNWIKILLYNFKASINHAGNISLPFNILRGCKQGDPIASALFILSIELLCIKLCNSTNMEGFKIMHKEEMNYRRKFPIFPPLKERLQSVLLQSHAKTFKGNKFQ